jgi:hypothetical protein
MEAVVMPTPDELHTATLAALDTLTTTVDRCQLVLLDVGRTLDQLKRALLAAAAETEAPCSA